MRALTAGWSQYHYMFIPSNAASGASGASEARERATPRTRETFVVVCVICLYKLYRQITQRKRRRGFQKDRKIRPSKYKRECLRDSSTLSFSVDGRISQPRQRIWPETCVICLYKLYRQITHASLTKIQRWPDQNPSSENFDGLFDGFSDFFAQSWFQKRV